MASFSRSPVLALLPLLLALASCSKDEERSKALEKGALNPPWDSPSFTPRELEGMEAADKDSTFFLFNVIGMIDSLSGDRKTWSLQSDAVDTVTLAQMLDTGFVFPQSPAASLPYAYDDSYRDDTLYRHAYGNGLFTQDHPCAATYVLGEPFLHPAKWLKAGLKEEEIIQALGTPAFRQRGVLRYFSVHSPAPAADTAAHAEPDVYEGVNFYFLKDSLFAAVLHRSQPCH